MAVEEQRTNPRDRASPVQGDGPEASHMLPVGLWLFVHEAQWAGERIGEGDAPCSQFFVESFREKVQNVTAPGEPAPILTRIARRQQLALPLDHIGLDLVAQGLRSRSRRTWFPVGEYEQG